MKMEANDVSKFVLSWSWAKSNGVPVKSFLDEWDMEGEFAYQATLVSERPKLGFGLLSQSGSQNRALVIQGLLTPISEQGLTSTAVLPPYDVSVETHCDWTHVDIDAGHRKLRYILLRSQKIQRSQKVFYANKGLILEPIDEISSRFRRVGVLVERKCLTPKEVAGIPDENFKDGRKFFTQIWASVSEHQEVTIV